MNIQAKNTQFTDLEDDPFTDAALAEIIEQDEYRLNLLRQWMESELS